MILSALLVRPLRVVLTSVPFALASVLVTGCDTERYPEDLTYPIRADPRVDETPTDPSAQPPGFDRPGEFPGQWLVFLKEKGAKVNDGQATLGGQDRADLEKQLGQLFGTPAHPKVEANEGVINDALGEIIDDYRGVSDAEKDRLRKAAPEHVKQFLARLDERTLAEGSRLYRRHCLHCHGLTGDGRGHTAPWINPHPRDFRRGMFKFTSSSQPQGEARKARREDLLRTIRLGVEGMAMPAFGLLPDDEIQALASYVIHLSLRGQTEAAAIFQRGDEGSVTAAATASLASSLPRWVEAEWTLIRPPENNYPYASDGDANAQQGLQQSITRGFQFFATNCLSCHENYGRKDVYKYDGWGTVVRPANLTVPVYRGGHRLIDLYWRVHAGINAANMPATVPVAMTPEQVWDVVNFVRAMPYPAMLPDEVREKIYAPAAKEGR